MKNSRLGGWLVIMGCFSFVLPGCQKAYFNTMEAFGQHKREILINRVQKTRNTQEEAKEEFQSALEQFRVVLGIDGGALGEKYDRLKDVLDESEDKAEAVHERVDEVEEVAEALFEEWEDELEDYKNDRLRRSSELQLKTTRSRYNQLIRALHQVENKMDPVLTTFRDNVLYLKHNLNAQAVASLQNQVNTIGADVEALVQTMEAAIAEANSFIAAMGGDKNKPAKG